MNNLEDRLPTDLATLASQMPTRDITDGSVRRGEQLQLCRRSIAATAGVAVVVAAIVVPLSTIGRSHDATKPTRTVAAQPLAHRYASLHRSSLNAAGPNYGTFGPIVPNYAPCPLAEIAAAAHLIATPHAEFGVVALRSGHCKLAPSTTPTLLDASGQALPIPRTAPATASNPAGYPVPYGNYGKASFGFTWRGSWCGQPAAAVRVAFPNGRVVIPLRGPSLRCSGASTSELIPGVIGPIHQAVQAAPPEWSRLTASLVAAHRTAGLRIRGLAVTFHNPTGSPIRLVPRPTFSVDVHVPTGESGGFLYQPLPRTTTGSVVPAHGSLTIHLPAKRYPDSLRHAFRGKPILLTFSIAGVPSATITTLGT